MARVFELNGTELDYVTGADWQDTAEAGSLAGVSPLRRRRRHVWRARVMPMAEFLSLQAQEGALAAITTTNYSDRNGDYVTYYGAEIERVSCRHEATNAEEVTVEFLVRV